MNGNEEAKEERDMDVNWIKATAVPLGENGEEGAGIKFDIDYKNLKGDILYMCINFWNDKGHIPIPQLLRGQADFIEREIAKKIAEDQAARKELEKKEESPIKLLKCEICYEIIGKFDRNELSIPFTGSMFKSKDPDHGVPDPFHPSLDWEFMRCPYCNKRPFLNRDKVMTPEGYCGPVYKCEICGREFEKPMALTGHMKAHRKAEEPLTDEETKRLDSSIYICKVCNKKFLTYMALVGHMRAHKDKKSRENISK